MMKVLISGAGIAGLSLALRLHQRGLSPVVVERYPGLRDGGYMLGLSDPGLDAAERMGVDALRAARHVPRRLVYIGPTGQERFAIDGLAIERLVGDREFNLMRGDIERALYERVRGEVEVRFGASVTLLGGGAGRGCCPAERRRGDRVRSRGRRGRPALAGPRAPLRAGGALGAPARRPRGRLSCSTAPAFPTRSSGASYWLTEVGRAAALGAVGREDAWSHSSSGGPKGGHGSAPWRRSCAAPSPGRAGTSRPCWTCCRRRTTCTSTRWPRS